LFSIKPNWYSSTFLVWSRKPHTNTYTRTLTSTPVDCISTGWIIMNRYTPSGIHIQATIAFDTSSCREFNSASNGISSMTMSATGAEWFMLKEKHPGFSLDSVSPPPNGTHIWATIKIDTSSCREFNSASNGVSGMTMSANKRGVIHVERKHPGFSLDSVFHCQKWVSPIWLRTCSEITIWSSGAMTCGPETVWIWIRLKIWEKCISLKMQVLQGSCDSFRFWAITNFTLGLV
jgi:hypothetical protein